MKSSRLLLPMIATALLCLAPTAQAQSQDHSDTDYLRDRIGRMEKQLSELRSIVFQARDTGQPVQVRDAGPDSQLIAIQTRVDDFSQSLRTLTGQVETLSHDLTLARKQLADAQAQSAALADRLDKLEKQVAPPPPPPPQAQAAPSGSDDAEPSSGDAKAAYARANGLMLDGDYAAASAAFQDYIDHYGDTPSAPRARYQLGSIQYAQRDYQSAATTLIGSIRGWPRTSWAPDAMVQLSLSLVQLGKAPDACRTLIELRRHYPAASTVDKAHARTASLKAGCGAR
jgi:tol-pal system protein YbgF